MSQSNRVQEQALEEIERAPDAQALQAVRVKYLGKKGEVTQQLKGLGKLPQEERKAVGQEPSTNLKRGSSRPSSRAKKSWNARR